MEPNGRKSTFTDKFIKSLQPENKIKDYREGGGRKGFGIRVHPSGAKVFFYCYNIDGARRFLNLGHYKDRNRKEPGISLLEAGDKYMEAALQVKAGIDPLQEKVLARLERKRTPTVKEVIETYI
ncbi:MAG: Arm DNA-binding domain-containing protein, partial [Geobacteraceae bacterium]|nr:Arm DNA-binding domain-containing protein [Geobacteraceae bacterium]